MFGSGDGLRWKNMDDAGLRTLVRARTVAETDELEKELLEVGGGSVPF